MAYSDIELDKTGFPMVWIDEIDAYIHWLPVTKVQFEYFLCDFPSPQFNESWYDDILVLNQRVSPKRAKENNYWQLLLTGIRPDEVQLFAEWCGDDYEIPTLDEWNQAYRSLKTMPSVENIFADIQLRERPRTMLMNVDKIIKRIYSRARRQCSQAEQMLMRYGVMEWVRCEYRGQEWGGMGQTSSGFQSMMRTPERGTPEIPRRALENRLHYYGFRLLRR